MFPALSQEVNEHMMPPTRTRAIGRLLARSDREEELVEEEEEEVSPVRAVVT